jgi:putative membrane protein
MTPEILVRYIHFISIFALVSTVVAEHLLLKKEMTRAEISRVSRIDAVYGLAAILVVTAGLILWFSGIGKPSVYYSRNWIFHLKVTMVVLVGLLSIYPTVFFIKNRKGNPSDLIIIPSVIFMLIRIELLLLLLTPLLAALMARGVGFFGN